MEKKLKKISVKTLPNGYGLTVGDVEYMYFNEMDLMAGFMSHVGLGEVNYMEKGSILSALMSAMLGESYADAVTTLKQRVGLLTSQYNSTIDRMDKAIEYVTSAEKTIDGMIKRIETIENDLKAMETVHAQNKKVVEDLKTKIAEIDKKSEKVKASLTNSATIMKAMEEVGDSIKNNKDQEDEVRDGTKKTETMKRKGGRNKAADEKIMDEIKKKAKKNPNIK